ncbi:class I SAM-dependent methyltransferase [Acinetobacter sp. Z1]|uniref:class I SAM-dependent methyltransferase n=1 Tax=Acinetobacter sp. Z1 TaxID=2953738 RepID=UPI0020C94356|nr:class I SAM-dependent methyltransferase [Acinetobacter sp. Z1]UTO19885.1 class I SAM-dependent methyltransferase [Acinetobacter sp. Z1]
MLYQFYQRRIFPHLLNQVMQTASLMDRRRELLLPIEGEVLEIGFGTGLNVPFYGNVDSLYALEPNPDIYQLAVERVQHAPFYIKHVQSSAEKLPFADASLDHIVSTWTLCSIPQLDQALAEIHRVLKPTGTFHLLEHVKHPDSVKIQSLQTLLTPIQKRIADGCHLNRDIERHVLQANFQFIVKDYFDAEGIPTIAQKMLLARVQKCEMTA